MASVIALVLMLLGVCAVIVGIVNSSSDKNSTVVLFAGIAMLVIAALL